jgi:zinc D-Ala-D-Ala dipeptidase
MIRTDLAKAAVLSIGADCGSTCAANAAPKEKPPHDFVRLADIAPRIKQDMRYAGPDNFTGRPVPGYCAAQCWLRREAGEALAAVQKDAERMGRSLIVYDGYRPQRATEAFVAWAADPSDQAMKAAYYPDVEKAALFELGYIAKDSAHSTGAAVDLGLIGLDFGTPLDFFDEASGAHNPAISEEAKQNRAQLAALMQRHGFAKFDKEWWHFTLEGLDGVAPHDFEVR